MRNELLDGLVCAKVAEVAENRHEPLATKRRCVHIDYSIGAGESVDHLIRDLVGEEGGDDREQAVDHPVMYYDVFSNRRNGEELDSKVFDGGFGLAINKEI